MTWSEAYTIRKGSNDHIQTVVLKSRNYVLACSQQLAYRRMYRSAHFLLGVLKVPDAPFFGEAGLLGFLFNLERKAADKAAPCFVTKAFDGLASDVSALRLLGVKSFLSPKRSPFQTGSSTGMLIPLDANSCDKESTVLERPSAMTQTMVLTSKKGFQSSPCLHTRRIPWSSLLRRPTRK